MYLSLHAHATRYYYPTEIYIRPSGFDQLLEKKEGEAEVAVAGEGGRKGRFLPSFRKWDHTNSRDEIWGMMMMGVELGRRK